MIEDRGPVARENSRKLIVAAGEIVYLF